MAASSINRKPTGPVKRATDVYLVSNEDSVYEQDVARDPGSTKPWLAYIEFKMKHGTLVEQAFVMERSCTQLPRSYKLWKMVSGQ